jgi:transposase
MHREWRAKVDLYAEIRRDHEGGAGIKALARKYKVHRRMVREALRSGLPAERKKPERSSPKLEPYMAWIEAILAADEQAPRKQRHTAQRIWTRLRQEFPHAAVGESTVRHYVGKRKRELRLTRCAVMVPQAYQMGVEAQVDFYEASVDLAGEREVLQIFCLRSMASGAAFHCAFRRQTQQALLEGHERAFAYFGGVFEMLRYDNLTLAVRKILKGRQRLQTKLFYAFQKHWGFRAEYCNPAAGHEKGGVEGENGWFRRNVLVPVPKAKDLAQFNEWLEEQCLRAEQRRITGREHSIAEARQQERSALQPLAAGSFDAGCRQEAKVDSKGCVQAHTNYYSTPLAPGLSVEVRSSATRVEVWHQGRCVAWHERLYVRYGQSLNLEHYLTALSHKPGALAGSSPLQQWRRAGRWPGCFDELWASLKKRQGETAGTRAMIGLLELGAARGWDQLREAVGTALEMGSRDAEAVRHLMVAGVAARTVARIPVEGRLLAYERTQPSVLGYDALLEGGVA